MTKLTPWHDFLIRLGYHNNPTIWAATPPAHVRTDAHMWEHLRDIKAGFILIPGCGLYCRAKLAQFLRENDPENVQ